MVPINSVIFMSSLRPGVAYDSSHKVFLTFLDNLSFCDALPGSLGQAKVEGEEFADANVVQNERGVIRG